MRSSVKPGVVHIVVRRSRRPAVTPTSSSSSRRPHTSGSSPGSRRPAGISSNDPFVAYRYCWMSSTVGSSPRGSEANGTTAAAPGCRTISSSPVEPSGKRTVSLSRSMTRPLWIRLVASCITHSFSTLEQPGERHLEAFGEQVPRVAARVGVNGRTGCGRCKWHESETGGDDLQPQHVKAVAHEQHSAAGPSVEPALYFAE